MTSLVVAGTDIAGMIKMPEGFKWSRNDLEGSGAGRSAVTGKAIRDLLASKIRLDCTCIEITGAQRTALESLLFSAPFLTVSCDDEIFRGVSRTMYCSALTAGLSRRKANGTEYWKGVEFSLVEE